MSDRRIEKVVLLEYVKEVFENSKFVLFISYSGLTVSEASELRGAAIKAGAKCQVLKNRFLKLAISELGLEVPEDFNLLGDTAGGVPGDELGRVVVQAVPLDVVERRGGDGLEPVGLLDHLADERLQLGHGAPVQEVHTGGEVPARTRRLFRRLVAQQVAAPPTSRRASCRLSPCARQILSRSA